jgi:hypothetical protein
MLGASEALREAAGCSGDPHKRFDWSTSRSGSLPFVYSRVDRATSAGDLSDAIAAFQKRQVDFCLEIGPAFLAPKLNAFVSECGADWVARPVLTPPGDTDEGILATVAAMYAAGASLDWKHIVSPGLACAGLPRYPWQRKRLWAIERDPSISAAVPSAVSADDASGEGIRSRPILTTPYVAPRSRLEEEIADSWSKIMRLDRVGIHDNFFELGGDSLKATILLNRLQLLLGEPVEAHALFHAQTIIELAAYLQSQFPEAVDRLSPSTGAGGTPVVIDNGAAVSDAIPRLSRDCEAEQLLSRVDTLTDEEVESLLQDSRPDSEWLYE